MSIRTRIAALEVEERPAKYVAECVRDERSAEIRDASLELWAEAILARTPPDENTIRLVGDVDPAEPLDSPWVLACVLGWQDGRLQAGEFPDGMPPELQSAAIVERDIFDAVEKTLDKVEATARALAPQLGQTEPANTVEAIHA